MEEGNRRADGGDHQGVAGRKDPFGRREQSGNPRHSNQRRGELCVPNRHFETPGDIAHRRDIGLVVDYTELSITYKNVTFRRDGLTMFFVEVRHMGGY